MVSPRPVDTLHGRILEELRRNIVEGRWEPGYRLPKETDLADSHGVSRMTMNKVLTQLAQEGYVVRRKRSGTVVAQFRAQSAVLEINNIGQEVAALGRPYRWELLKRERRHLNQTDVRELGIRRPLVEEEVLYLQGLHFAGEEPFCLETRAIDLVVVPTAEERDFTREVPGNWLLRTMPWSTARHQVRAVNVAGRDAKLLDLPLGAACLEVQRKTEIEGAWVTYARLLYPGEVHQLVAEFEPRAAPDPPPS